MSYHLLTLMIDFDVHVCVLWTCPPHHLNTFLLSDTRCYRLTCAFPAPALELAFSLRSFSSFCRESGIRCTHCYGGMARAGGGCFQSTELQIIQTYVHTHIYTHIRTHIYNYTYVYIFTHTYIYVYTCIYTYTHLNLYLLCILTTMSSHWYLPFPFNPKEFIQVPSCPYL